MTRVEKNKLAMYRATDAILVANQHVIDDFLPLAEPVEKFRRDIQEITARDLEHGGTTGATASKNTAVDAMLEYVTPIASALYSFGRKTGNDELKQSCRYSPTELFRLSDQDLEKCCSLILASAQAHAADLAAYRISNEKITSLQQSIETYKGQSDHKDGKFAESKAARGVLSDLFVSIDETLREDLDRLMDLLKNDETDFYNTYKAARNIKEVGGGSSKNPGKMITDKS